MEELDDIERVLRDYDFCLSELLDHCRAFHCPKNWQPVRVYANHYFDVKEPAPVDGIWIDGVTLAPGTYNLAEAVYFKRVNDHAETWELTREELRFISAATLTLDDTYMAIATAAVKKYQEWLAKQCGDYPCESRVKAREREIVEWLKAQRDREPQGYGSWALIVTTVANDLEAWLQGKE